MTNKEICNYGCYGARAETSQTASTGAASGSRVRDLVCLGGASA